MREAARVTVATLSGLIHCSYYFGLAVLKVHSFWESEAQTEQERSVLDCEVVLAVFLSEAYLC